MDHQYDKRTSTAVISINKGLIPRTTLSIRQSYVIFYPWIRLAYTAVAAFPLTTCKFTWKQSTDLIAWIISYIDVELSTNTMMRKSKKYKEHLILPRITLYIRSQSTMFHASISTIMLFLVTLLLSSLFSNFLTNYFYDIRVRCILTYVCIYR